MPILYSVVDISPREPGFLLPLFRSYQGANVDLTQIIDTAGNIEDFTTVLVAQEASTVLVEEVETQVGSPAIWAFRDPSGQVHIGDANFTQQVGLELLASGQFDKHPVSGAEMAGFCDADVNYPKLMAAAYAQLSALSSHGAAVWRDAVLLLPLIKADVAVSVKSTDSAQTQIRDIIAIAHRQTMHIYIPSDIPSREISFSRSKALAKIFGIYLFTVHSTQGSYPRASDRTPAWSVLGIGGIARFVIKAPPFHGTLGRFAGHIPGGGVIAHGPALMQNLIELESAGRLLIGIFSSDDDQAIAISRASRGKMYDDDSIIRHAINIRPIGFGTPSPHKLSVPKLKGVLPEFDFYWILANHRQRQTGSYQNSLSVSNLAARYVRSLTLLLVNCRDNPEGREILESTIKSKKYGLFGAAKYAVEDDHGVVVRVLYSMLCEDAYLHAAERIIIFWPYIVDRVRHMEVQLGRRSYEVEVVRRQGHHSNDVTGMALGVQLSRKTREDFREFCISLLVAYGWVLRFQDGESLVLENEGEGLRVWPAHTMAQVSTLLSRSPEYGPEGDLIITNKTIPQWLRAIGTQRGWGLIHYSELARWMKKVYRLGVFRDL